MATNNPPDVLIELTREQAEFLIENCEVNMDLALRALQVLQERSSLEKMVHLNEKFREIREATKKGMTP